MADIVHRLRSGRISQLDRDEAADKIERLHGQLGQLASALADRDALIAEALAAQGDPRYSNVETDRIVAILSRAPQGAKYEDHACSLCGDIHEREPADRRGEAGDGPGPTDDPVPLGSDRDHNSTDCYLGNHEKCKACGCDCHAGSERVVPDREALLAVLNPGDGGSAFAGRVLHPDQAAAIVDALIASGALGVSADLIRAEALEEAGRDVAAMYDHDPQPVDAWLFARAAEYRKAADHG